MLRKITGRLQGILIGVGFAVILLVVASYFLPEGARPGSILSTILSMITLGNRQVEGPVVPALPGGDRAEQDLLVLNRSLSGNPADNPDDPQQSRELPYYISYLEAAEGRTKLRWEYLLGSDTAVFPLKAAGDGQSVYVMSANALLALDAVDGALRWQATLSDQIRHDCSSCLIVMPGETPAGDRVLVLTADRMFHGLDSRNGQVVWSQRLNAGNVIWESPPQIVEGLAVVADALPGDPSAAALFFFDLVEGHIVTQIAPNCVDGQTGQTAHFGLGDEFAINRVEMTVDFVFGTTSGACYQRWSYASGELLAGHHLDRNEFPFDSIRSLFVLGDVPKVLFHGDSLYLAGREGISHATLENGQVSSLLEQPDYNFAPVGVQGNVLVVLAQRNRGTRLFELWGVDLLNGSTLWQKQIDDDVAPSSRLSPGEGWSYRWTPRGLALLDLYLDNNRPFVRVEVVAPESGEIIVSNTSRVGDRFWSGVTWTGRYAYLTLRHLYRVDLTTGEVAAEWPIRG